MTTITFKPEFESKLKRLRIKTKFVKNLKGYVKQIGVSDSNQEILNQIIKNLNTSSSWDLFITRAFTWCETPEGRGYWLEISQINPND